MVVTKHKFVFLLLALAFAQTPAQQQDIYKKFAGTYVTGQEFGGASLTLKSDGRFSDESGSDDGSRISTSGTYSLSNGQLYFRVIAQFGKRVDARKKFNLLDPKESKQFYDGDSVKIEKEFKMWPVEWAGRIYLLDDDDLKSFANAINLGIEPRATLTSSDYVSPWYGSFYLRTGDEQSKKT